MSRSTGSGSHAGTFPDLDPRVIAGGAKQSVNNTLDQMGMYPSIQSAFALHHVGHDHNARVHGRLVDPAGAKVISDEA